MNFKHSIALLSLLLAAPFAQADVSRFYHTDYDLNLQPDDPTYDKPLADAALVIDSFGLGHVSIEAIVQPASDNAAFDGGKLMYLPRNMEFTNDFSLNPIMKGLIDIESVFSHEYGHAVFDQVAVKALPLYSQIIAIKMKQSEIDLKILHEQPSPAIRNELHAQQKALDGELIKMPPVLHLYILSLPYNELFADVIAVYQMQDKSAIYKALDNPNVKHHQFGPDALDARDFAADNKLEGWSDNSPHGMFGPVRSYLGRDECWPKTQEERSHKLKAFAEIILKDIKERFEAGATAAEPSFNAALIQKLAPVCAAK